MDTDFSFRPGERLKKEQDIKTLFQTGKAFSVYPVRVVWLARPRTAADEYPVRIGVSAPKKKFARAVDRNRIKRVLREGWRLQKGICYSALGHALHVHVFFTYTAADVSALEAIPRTVSKIITRLIAAIALEEAGIVRSAE